MRFGRGIYLHNRPSLFAHINWIIVDVLNLEKNQLVNFG